MRLWTQKYQIHLEHACYRLGLSVGYHPWRWIFGLLLITLVSSVGFLRFHQINNARITFTASDSMSHVEGKVMEEFLQQNGTLHMIEVMIFAADNGSLMRDGYQQQLWDLTVEIASGIKVLDTDGQMLSYKNMCHPYCEKNDAFYALMKIQNSTELQNFELTYPSLNVFGKSIFIANNIYNVTTVHNSSNIESFKSVILRYYMVHHTLKTMLKWEDELVKLLYESHKFPLLRAGAASDNLVAKEVRAMGTRTAPLLAISLVLLSFFLVICSFRYKRRESKPWEALLGAGIPILAGLTTVGMVSATGLAFQSIVVSSLFLLLAIGIDDVFIMLSAWHRTDRQLDIPERIAGMVKESGCSMTVTSVTNIISFGNGVLSTTPVLQTFAIYSTVASVVCFFYQLILFPAIIALTAPREYKKIDDHSQECLPEEIKIIKPLGKVQNAFWKRLAIIVTHPFTAVITIAALFGYWYLAVYGIWTVKTDLSVQKLAPQDARIVQFKNEYDAAIKVVQSVAVIVTNPGDLRNETQRAHVGSLVRDFETASYAYGSNSTFYFLKAYMDFLQFFHSDDEEPVEFQYISIPHFIEEDTYWRPTIRVNETACARNEPECISAFLFTTGFTSVVRYNEMYPLIEEWRAIAKQYPSLGVYAYTERSNFADQTAALPEIVWETLLSEVICMAISFVFLVPDSDSIIAATFALLSVNLGVFGFLSLWGVGIDPVSMSALLMSIGFSVDIAAHISYHYYTVLASSARERLEDAFVNIGWSTVQGGLSTLLAMLPILLRPSYLGMVFLKAVTLVIVFGLIHGLIVLPVFLSLIDKFCGSKKVFPSPASSCDSLKSSIKPHRISIKSFTNYRVERY